MKAIAQLKLNPTPAQADALRRTLETGNAACNTISRTAFDTQTFHRYHLQSLVYHTIKSDFGLSAQMVIRCLAKVADAYARDTTTLHQFRRDGAIAFDDRILSWNTTNETVSIWSVEGRLNIPYQMGERQRTYLPYRQGETDLAMTGDAFYLLAVCDIPTPTPEAVEDVLGVDLGIVNLATDSDAVMAGIPVVLVCAAYTSQGCAQCGHTAKANRRTQAIFCCGACGHTGAADVNAARTISRAAVILPIVSDAPCGGSARDKPRHCSGCGL